MAESLARKGSASPPLVRRTVGALRRPSFWPVVLRRAFPVKALLRDPELYQAVSGWSSGRLPRVSLRERFPGIEDVEVKLVGVHGRTLDTSVNTPELVAMLAIVRHTRARRLFEIGTADGFSAVNLAANTRADALIATLDLAPPGGEGSGRLRDKDPALPGAQASGARIDTSPHACRIRQLWGDSTRIDWDQLPGPFDFIFIDGSHEHDDVVQDTDNAVRHLAPHGVILWHDYGQIPDVSRAVDEAAGRLRCDAIAGTRLAVATHRG